MNKILLLTLSIAGFPLMAQAQTIVPDVSLPNQSVVDTADELSTITGGTTAGDNLFHSFEDFSVPTGTEAFFDNASDISNIFSRVTGSSISDIDGLIRANGDANLFLLNPNGIIFGENASLDIGGEFSAIAGEAIRFADGEYSAIAPGNSILSFNLPLGVQLGQAPGNVEVNGSGSGLFINQFFEADFTDKEIGLSNSNINLIGGEINLNGGNVTAFETLNLTAATGQVNYNGKNLDTSKATGLGNINLINASSLDSSFKEGAGTITIDSEFVVRGSVTTTNSEIVDAGTININAANLSLDDGSSIIAVNDGEAHPGLININTSESVNIAGEAVENFFPTFIGVDNNSSASQPGGTINLKTPNLTIDTGAIISASTFGNADGGTINITASQVDVISGGSFASSIIVETGGTGNGGILNLNADNLYVGLGGSIGGTSFGDGQGGTLNLKSQNITFADAEIVDDESFAPLILADNLGDGSGGIINIESENLTIADSAQVSVSTTGTGNGGTININSTNLTVTNSSTNSPDVTGILSASGIELTDAELGNGGNINISSDNIQVENDALITARTLSPGNAGNITIDSGNLKVNNEAVINTLTVGSGNGGTLAINTDNLTITDAGQLTTGTDDAGQGGNLTINANEIKVSGVTEEGSSAILSTGIIGTGNSGNIDITTNILNLENGGTISASNFSTENAALTPGQGAPGTINIDANKINISEETGNATGISTAVNDQSGGEININSDRLTIIGEAASISGESLGEGNGGDISIKTSDLQLESAGSIAVSASATGNAGNIALTGGNIEGDRGNILAESIQSGGGDITIQSKEIELNNNSLISTSVAQSDGGGGDISIINDEFILLRNNSDIRANAFAGPGGNIDITSNLLFQDLTSEIDASSRFGLDGTIELTTIDADKTLITAILPELIQPTVIISGTCPIGDENSFAYVGNGGTPTIPSDAGTVQTTWNDLRPINSQNSNVPIARENNNNPIYEADNLVTDTSGDIYLVAKTRLNSDRWSKSNCH